jgi:hypothetical protein
MHAKRDASPIFPGWYIIENMRDDVQEFRGDPHVKHLKT